MSGNVAESDRYTGMDVERPRMESLIRQSSRELNYVIIHVERVTNLGTDSAGPSPDPFVMIQLEGKIYIPYFIL